MSRLLLVLILSVGSTAVFAQDRLAQCQEVRHLINDFFNKRGLCFTNPRAKYEFPRNQLHCIYKHSSDVPISENERWELNLLQIEEKELACPRP
jgi:hypothetical protein